MESLSGKNQLNSATDLRQEYNLVQSELERFQFLVEHTSEQIALFTKDCRFLYVNDAFCQRYGYSREEVLELLAYDIKVDGTPQEFEQLWHAAQQQESIHLNAQHRTKSGEIFDIDMRLKYFRSNGEEFLCAFGRDITKRKQTEESLYQSNAVLNTINSATPTLVYVKDQQGRMLMANPAVLAAVGKPAEEVLGKTSLEFHAPLESALKIQENDRFVIEAGQSQQFEEELDSAEGRRVFVSTKSPYRDKQGNVIGIIGISSDITNHKRLEADLREALLLYRNLADTIPQIFWTALPDGFIDYYNQRWYDYTGMTYEQTQGWGWKPILHPDDLQKCIDIWGESVRTGENYQIEYRFRRFSDGQYRWHLGRAFPLRDDQGQIVKWFGSSTDIHDQKSAIEERNQALEHERLARLDLEKANRIKDEFLAVLSHELRTPLNPILGWAKLLRAGKVAPNKTDAALETIERNAKLQAQLIEDLLDVSRILQGKLRLNAIPIDLAAIITDAVGTVQLAAEAKEISLSTSLIQNIVQVIGDAGRLQQVVWNLLSNAVKFTPSSGQVKVLLKHTTTDAYIIVSDTGKGIAADFLPYVFDYFRQEDGAITRRFGGLGLGLAIVRQIVELHGGRVSVDSPGENQGATFTVQLPLMQHESSPLAVTSSEPKI